MSQYLTQQTGYYTSKGKIACARPDGTIFFLEAYFKEVSDGFGNNRKFLYSVKNNLQETDFTIIINHKDNQQKITDIDNLAFAMLDCYFSIDLTGRYAEDNKVEKIKIPMCTFSSNKIKTIYFDNVNAMTLSTLAFREQNTHILNKVAIEYVGNLTQLEAISIKSNPDLDFLLQETLTRKKDDNIAKMNLSVLNPTNFITKLSLLKIKVKNSNQFTNFTEQDINTFESLIASSTQSSEVD